MVVGTAISKAATQTRVHEIKQASLKSKQNIYTSYCFWKKKKKKNIHGERTKWTWLKEWSMEQRDGVEKSKYSVPAAGLHLLVGEKCQK